MPGIAEREDPLLCPAFLLVAPRPADRRVEPVLVERLLQRLGLHDLRVQCRSGGDWVDAAVEPLLVDMHDQVEAEPLRGCVAERDHLAEFPGGVDVQQREGRLRRIERLQREVQQNARILADRVHQHRVAKLGRDLAQDRDRLRLQPSQMRRQLRTARHQLTGIGSTAIARREGVRSDHRPAIAGGAARQRQTNIVEQGLARLRPLAVAPPVIRMVGI